MLSIIIPTLNEEKYLPQLLECIKSQIVADHEIIVSDGRSNDATVKIAKKHGCRVVVSSKRSPAHQRNEGAKIARGDTLLFLDADTILPDDFFQPVLDEFTKRKLDVAGFYFRLNSDKLVYKVTTVWNHLSIFILHRLHPISIGAAIIVKKPIHDSVHGFDNTIHIGEDHNYSKTIKKAKGSYGMIKSRIILYSIRRFEKEGLMKVTFKWYYALISYMLHGPSRKKVVEYRFGHY